MAAASYDEYVADGDDQPPRSGRPCAVEIYFSEVIYIPFERYPLWLLNGVPTDIGALSGSDDALRVR
jgi:hypothetical protein